jgi:hypothetical protein
MVEVACLLNAPRRIVLWVAAPAARAIPGAIGFCVENAYQTRRANGRVIVGIAIESGSTKIIRRSRPPTARFGRCRQGKNRDLEIRRDLGNRRAVPPFTAAIERAERLLESGPDAPWETKTWSAGSPRRGRRHGDQSMG